MASKAVKTVAKAVAEYQYPWKEKLAKHKNELSKGVRGYWNLGAGHHSTSVVADAQDFARKSSRGKTGHMIQRGKK